jgi:hypothetical protein
LISVFQACYARAPLLASRQQKHFCSFNSQSLQKSKTLLTGSSSFFNL